MNPATIQPKVPKNLITGNVFPESLTFANTILFDNATVGIYIKEYIRTVTINKNDDEISVA